MTFFDSKQTESTKHERYVALIENHKGIIFKIARSYCHDVSDREDLIQEIMAQIWRSLDSFNDEFKISTWMYRVALNVAISFYRKDKSSEYQHQEVKDKLLTYDMSEETERSEDLEKLYTFIGELSDIDKAIVLMYLEGESQSEIASNMDMSISNVSTRLGRIKQKLTTKFK